MKRLFIIVVLSLFAVHVFAEQQLDVSKLNWQAITFGQSTDLNFGSTILPEKIGVNEVTVNGKPVKEGELASTFTIESRGGKLANSHEGITFYYTVIPSDVDFKLSANIKLEQLGPETGATPNFQEGAGIMVRDIVGPPRLSPQPEGHEEFPAASNMAANVIVAHSRVNDGKVNVNTNFRQGVYSPWGTRGNMLIKSSYVEGLGYKTNNQYNMSLSRSDGIYKASFEANGLKKETIIKNANVNIVEIQDNQNQYIGFFASRNAKITVSNVSLSLSSAKKDKSPKFRAKEDDLVVQDMSSNLSAVNNYDLLARANHKGAFQVLNEENEILASSKVLNAGSVFKYSSKLKNQDTSFRIMFKAFGNQAKDFSYTKTVSKVKVANPLAIYVSPQAETNGEGSKENPMSLLQAIEVLATGGTIYLEDGKYKGVLIPLTASGSYKNRKTLKAIGKNVVFTENFVHEASFWDISNIEVAGAMLIVNGSYNNFNHIVTHGAKDTGFQITSPSNVGKALWASYNTVSNSESYNNMDASQINADGFAAKMRVGNGNTFINCIAHHNIDDGWDLFNKVEDGANGVVTIIDSIAFKNGNTLKVKHEGSTRGNGFKLGGEGIPVNHVIKNSLAFMNNMDGFTDNFNPGTLVVDNNVAIDNKRFNFLFRKSPHAKTIKQGVFTNNISLRYSTQSKYKDVVNSSSSKNNQFIEEDKLTPSSALIKESEVKAILGKENITKEDALKLKSYF